MLSIRLIDFNISNISNIVDEDIEIDEEEENNNKSNIDNTNFTIQIFGLDENVLLSVSPNVKHFNPSFELPSLYVAQSIDASLIFFNN